MTRSNPSGIILLNSRPNSSCGLRNATEYDVLLLMSWSRSQTVWCTTTISEIYFQLKRTCIYRVQVNLIGFVPDDDFVVGDAMELTFYWGRALQRVSPV